MTGILGEIIEYKRDFVEECKRRLPLREIEMMAAESVIPRDFAGALSGKGCALIAEIKTASPSRGIIRDDVTSEDVARCYTENGASCISVLTDEKYFMGNLDRLTNVRRVTSLPVLRKDFIIDSYQIYEARFAGADAVLLIAACLDNSVLSEFIEIAVLLGMECLVEVHDTIEMERVADLDTRLIGINNRNLKTFETDISVTEVLARYAPEHALLISESGIFTAGDVRTVHKMGAHAVLVGEAIMREKDMAKKIRELSQAVKCDK
ncbi:indole-3-glycerol phosphate synthase TrpC [Candidatus Latescibacterota bacterium]